MKAKGVFDDDANEAEDLMNLFIAQIHPPPQVATFDTNNAARISDDAHALATFKAFKAEALALTKFASVGAVKQLGMIKDWLSTSIENIEKKSPEFAKAAKACKLVAEAFKPIIYDVIQINRKQKRDEYAKLAVENTLDVLDKITALIDEPTCAQ